MTSTTTRRMADRSRYLGTERLMRSSPKELFGVLPQAKIIEDGLPRAVQATGHHRCDLKHMMKFVTFHEHCQVGLQVSARPRRSPKD